MGRTTTRDKHSTPALFAVMASFRNGSSLTSSERIMLAVLADHANGDYRCWPSLRTLSRETGLSRASTWRAVKRLEASGLLQVGKRPTRSCGSVNEYVLLLPPSQGETGSTKNKLKGKFKGPGTDVPEPSKPSRVEISKTAIITIIARKESWSREACALWEEKYGAGSAPGGRIGSGLKRVVEVHSWAVVGPAWSRYLGESTHPSPSAQDFAAHVGEWLPGGRGNGKAGQSESERLSGIAAWVRGGGR